MTHPALRRRRPCAFVAQICSCNAFELLRLLSLHPGVCWLRGCQARCVAAAARNAGNGAESTDAAAVAHGC